MNHKAVLFDMDGVIVNNEPLHTAAFQTALKRYGHTLSEDQYKQHFAGKTDKDGFKHYFNFIEQIQPPAILDEKARAYLELATEQLMTYPGAIELIHGLAKQKVPLALVTGSLRSEAEIVLKTFDIAKYFTKVITAEDTTLAKPNPEGYLKAAVALECDPTDCIVIEDSPNGVRAARAAGMKCLAVTTTHLPDELSEANSIVDRLRPGCLNSF